MGTIHFRIDEEIKRLAMQAAERHQVSLTELMRQRAEELAEEERQHQLNAGDEWLEAQVREAFARYDAGESEFISNEDASQQMNELKARAARGEL
ncbi:MULTISPECIES: damage-inducible protein J [unclassified Brenneria]|uniref:damage-inducible protein J n=1 Tax=unclassified Brenneria TaxID=2634434 RepID=UPI0018F107FB|nr:damage-inducible protein J [Brenneria sp. L3-3C-1]MBJ7224034.1 damage-inducible protein J [Brenneria sp. L3-3C-1]MEE3645279.1 damage-inducible protein J [Brenneria sp. L3_3C_1]